MELKNDNILLSFLFKIMTEIDFKGRNKELLNLFSKFHNEKNYDELYQKLKGLSEFYLRDMLKLGDLEIPDIGPNPEILDFHLMLQDWDEKNREEVKYAIKVYEGGTVESLEEAIILMEILKRNHPEKREIIDVMINDIINNKFEDIFDYMEILKVEQDNPSNILFSSLFFFFTSMLDQ